MAMCDLVLRVDGHGERLNGREIELVQLAQMMVGVFNTAPGKGLA